MVKSGGGRGGGGGEVHQLGGGEVHQLGGGGSSSVGGGEVQLGSSSVGEGRKLSLRSPLELMSNEVWLLKPPH
jgi:hypothetical protein